MKNFDSLLNVIELLEADGSREKAKDFKKGLKPYFKKMQAAQIGDPRRYTFMMVWPFLRDVIGISDMQGQDTPLNYNNILRKLEEVSDRGELPDDASEQWEKYAQENFDDFVDSISATRQPRSRKSHTRGRDVKNVTAVAGEEGTGFTEGETASERAKRIEMEKELEQDVKERTPEEVRDEFNQALTDIAGKLKGKGVGLPEFGETYTKQDTYLVEIVFDQNVVQKQALINLFPKEDLASPVERSSRGFDVELLPSSKIAQQIKYHGVEKVEQYLQQMIEDKLGGVGVRVNIMEPETEEPAGKLVDVYSALKGNEPGADAEEDDCGFCDDDHMEDEEGRFKGEYYAAGENRKPDAEADVQLPQGVYTVSFRGGKAVDVRGPGADFNVAAINNYLAKGWKLKDALISSRNTRTSRPVMDSVLAYMPPAKPFTPPVLLETTRDRYKPKTSHQFLEYEKHFSK